MDNFIKSLVTVRKYALLVKDFGKTNKGKNGKIELIIFSKLNYFFLFSFN